MKKNIKNGKYNKDKWSDFLDKAEERRNPESKNTKYEKYKNKFIEYMREYAHIREKELDLCLSYYKEAITTTFFDNHYITLNDKYIRHILSSCKIMIITANPIERAVLHHKVVDDGSVIMTRVLCETTAYYVFKLGKYWVAHIHQSQTGASKDMGTNFTISDALKLFTPNVIIALGIAFGIDYKTQNIGDVLVSRRLFPYSENKRDEDYVKPDRTQDKTIDDWLHVRLENAIGFLDGVTYGDILSGGSVMSSCEEKDRVCLGYTKADFIIGGEMEGNAVFQYSKRVGIPGVVIKGICDWGVVKNGIYEGNQDKEEKLKDSLQAYAMMQTVEKCEPLFNDKELFSSPRNINISKLNTKYHTCLCVLLVSQLLMIINGMYRLSLYSDYINFKYIYLLFDEIDFVLNRPITWLIIPIILFLKTFIALIIKLKHKTIWRIYVFFKRHWRR